MTLTPTTADLLLADKITLKVSFDKDVSDPKVEWNVLDPSESLKKECFVKIKEENPLSLTLERVNPEETDCVKHDLYLYRKLTVTATSNGITKSATVELKPYLKAGMRYSKILENKYRDYNTQCFDPEKCYDSSLGELECSVDNDGNLKPYYDDLSTQVMNQDMMVNYVLPKVYTVKDENGKETYYGTRASVLAAARFLVTQFPKDIPYASETMMTKRVDRVPTLARYTWTSDEYDKTLASLNVRIYGLNLTKKAYNDYTSFKDENIILGKENEDDKQKIVTPWGCNFNKAIYSSLDDSHFPRNGLRCTGFIAWAFQNGLFNLGDWNTILLGYNEFCKIKKDEKDEYIRCFRIEEVVKNEYKKPGTDKLLNYSNPNGYYYDDVYEKLKKLTDDDFVSINSSSLIDENGKITFKAGDLLWLYKYNCTVNKVGDKCPAVTEVDWSQCETIYGHIAMILGIERNADDSLKYIFVAEATRESDPVNIKDTKKYIRKSSGNNLMAYTLEVLTGEKTIDKKYSKWKSDKTEPTEDQNDKSKCKYTYKDTRLIRMDNVYNYYKDKVKVDLNTYNYDEKWW